MYLFEGLLEVQRKKKTNNPLPLFSFLQHRTYAYKHKPKQTTEQKQPRNLKNMLNVFSFVSMVRQI